MGKLQRFWSNVRKLPKRMNLSGPGIVDPREFIGRKVWAKPDLEAPAEEIVLQDIAGSIKHVKFFEINGTHWVRMDSFYTQMLENRLPSKEEEEEFELATEIKDIRPLKGKTS